MQELLIVTDIPPSTYIFLHAVDPIAARHSKSKLGSVDTQQLAKAPVGEQPYRRLPMHCKTRRQAHVGAVRKPSCPNQQPAARLHNPSHSCTHLLAGAGGSRGAGFLAEQRFSATCTAAGI